MGELYYTKPPIFNRPDLRRLLYIETRRTSPTNMSGNVGDTPAVMSHENHIATGSHDAFEEWKSLELEAARDRLGIVQAILGLRNLARIKVEHGTNILMLDDTMSTTTYDIPFEKRPAADASLLTTPGDGTLFAPADCVVATVVYPHVEAVGQIHSGIRGSVKELIPQAMQTFADQGLDPSLAAVYLAPHARSGFQLSEAEADEVAEIARINGAKVTRELTRYTRPGEHGLPIMDLTQFAIQHFLQSGVRPDNIEVAPEDTLSDPTLYSDYNSVTRGVVNGRFGVITGISQD